MTRFTSSPKNGSESGSRKTACEGIDGIGLAAEPDAESGFSGRGAWVVAPPKNWVVAPPRNWVVASPKTRWSPAKDQALLGSRIRSRYDGGVSQANQAEVERGAKKGFAMV